MRHPYALAYSHVGTHACTHVHVSKQSERAGWCTPSRIADVVLASGAFVFLRVAIILRKITSGNNIEFPSCSRMIDSVRRSSK